MNSSVRGLLVASGTAVTVLVVGLVFVGGGKPAPAEKPAVPPSADESTLSLEARRQARLAESQAMLGVPQAPAVQAIPAEIPAEPRATGSPDADVAPKSGAAAEPEGDPRPAAGDRPKVLPVSLPSGSPTSACTIATSPESPIGVACQEGGRASAKRAMKQLVKEAKKRGARFTCEGCHVDLDHFTLREDARSEFTSLLAAAETK